MESGRSSGKYVFLLNLLSFLFFLYMFFVSIELMGEAFKGFGRGFAEKLISTTSNPFVGLFIGILTTSIVQSSSLTTSILVGMVAAGTITIQSSIPVIMGANIGTTVTNVIVSLGHITRKHEFERAFAGATLHDFFNILNVTLLLPLHLLTQQLFGKSFLEFMATGLSTLFENVGGMKFASPLSVIVSPATKLLHNHLLPLILSPFGQISDTKLAIAALVLSLAMLFLALTYMVKSMRAALLVKVENLFDSYIFKNGLRSFLVGSILTATIQSSSVTTSLMVPIVGAGILTLERVFPYVLGANIGTTITAILASLVTGSKTAVTVAFVHLFFNVIGTIVWYPLKKVPITMSKKLAKTTLKSRKIAIIYVLMIFYIIPGLLILLTR